MSQSDGTPPHHSRFRGQDGVTDEERHLPPGSSADFERQFREEPPEQKSLFETDAGGALTTATELAPLEPGSSLPLARTWYREDLVRQRRPANTVNSYSYDLMVLEELIGVKPIEEISSRDIARYLGSASSKSTRKRRLTSARRFFRFLIEQRALHSDPTEGYFPHHIGLRLPVPLFADEQDRLLASATADEPWSELAVRFMMQLGLTRAELLGLRRDHIDRTNESAPVVYIYYGDRTKRSKERSLIAGEALAECYADFLDTTQVQDVLFSIGPPAVNGMVDRVREAAGITKVVTPQTLRHTYAVEQARNGADAERLLALLGLTDDPRNRESVDRYLKLAHAANEPEPA